MTFVTVGTHEQPFDRVLRAVDALAERYALPTPILCQIGYSEYEPTVAWERMLPFAETQERLRTAAVVITHGGPGSVMPALAAGRPTVLVPRQRGHDEHVDDHQVAFCRRISEVYGVPTVEDVGELEAAVAAALASPPATVERAGVAPAIDLLEERVEALLRPPRSQAHRFRRRHFSERRA